MLDIEWIALKAGIKPGNRITVTGTHAAELERRVRQEHFHLVRSERPVEFPGREPALIYYVAPDLQRARDLAEAEAPLLPPHGARLCWKEAAELHTHLGRLLGFPACCVERFVLRLRRGVNVRSAGGTAHEDFVAAEDASGASVRYFGRLNDLSADRRARLITFYPCRYDCPDAAQYAGAVFEAAKRQDALAAEQLREALLGTMQISVSGDRQPGSDRNEDVLTIEFREF